MKIVVTRPIPGDWKSKLGGHEIEVCEFGSAGPTEAQLVRVARDAEAMITMLSDPISSRVIDECPHLKVIAQYAVGFDNIDLDAASSRGIVVTNTPDVLTHATADFAFALLLSVARRIREADRYVREGQFTRWETSLLLGMDLQGKTIGIVGMGRIGMAMARRALGFGMKVVYHNRTRANITHERVLSARYVTLEALLRKSDVVSLHCNLTQATRHLIDEQAFREMKSTSILVNTARGAVVDENALVAALEAGQIVGAGLDVFEDEPEVRSGLMSLDNVVLAPHLGSATVETRTKMADMCAEAIGAVGRGVEDIPYRVV